MQAHNVSKKVPNRKILVADDSLTIRMQVKELLEDRGFNVVLVENGLKCLKALEEEEPDVILLDIIMPELDGIEACRRIKLDEKFEDIPILILTTVTDVENKVKGLNAGADDYITKPFEIAELEARINVLIRNKELKHKLKLANQKILDQQKSVVEEERLKVLLQMSGATAHELNQPLMALLGNIDLIRMQKNNPKKLDLYASRIEESGQRISEIVKKIQNIRRAETKPYFIDCSIINIDQKTIILSVEDSDDDFEVIQAIFDNHSQIELSRVRGTKEALDVLKEKRFDLILLDFVLPDGNGLDFLKIMENKGFEIPVVIITGQGNEMIASQIIQAGAYDYLPKAKLTDESVFRCIANAFEKDRLKREIKAANEKMAEMSTRDALTGLYNRRYFMEVIS